MINLDRRNINMKALQVGAHSVNKGADARTKWRVKYSRVKCGSQDMRIIRSKLRRVKALDIEVSDIVVYSINH